MQDGVGFVRALLQCCDCFGRRKHEQFDLAALGFAFHVFHHWQCSGAGADHEASALPGDL
jgi:hypothetical protein